MQIPRIYHSNTLNVDSQIKLEPSATHHLLKVLRLRSGAPVELFNGDGNAYQGTLSIEKNHAAIVTLHKCSKAEVESPLFIHLGQGISRGDRMDYAIQKAVELGVGRITPLFTTRCGVKLSAEKKQKRLDHWRAVAISACEQSGRCIIPDIMPPTLLSDWLLLFEEKESIGFVCDPKATNNIFSSDMSVSSKRAHILIGPEGGLTEEEVQLSSEARCQVISLGPRTLRTETAAVVSITQLQSAFGDL